MAGEILGKCERCGQEIFNIEYSHSAYETGVCLNKNCTIFGITQLHREKQTNQSTNQPTNSTFESDKEFYDHTARVTPSHDPQWRAEVQIERTAKEQPTNSTR